MKKTNQDLRSLIDAAAGEIGLDDDTLRHVSGGLESRRIGLAETFCDYTCSTDSCCQSGGGSHVA